MSKIQIQGLCKVFGEPRRALEMARAGAAKSDVLRTTGSNVALHDISLDIAAGEIFVIMGLSGSGKSTLVRHVNRLIEPSDGQLLIDGKDILRLDARGLRELRRHRISMVFQAFGLMPHQTVLENAAYACLVRGDKRAHALEAARHWIATVGLQGYEDKFPDELSGGMKQRVGLARALATDSDILLMDEAFSALDPLIRTEMQDQLLRLQETLKKTIVFVTHDIDEALRIGNRIAILRDGRLVQTGTREDIVRSPANDYVRRFIEKRPASAATSGALA
jgi:glycine betaine/proline transport system ATP-binding protein